MQIPVWRLTAYDVANNVFTIPGANNVFTIPGAWSVMACKLPLEIAIIGYISFLSNLTDGNQHMIIYLHCAKMSISEIADYNGR